MKTSLAIALGTMISATAAAQQASVDIINLSLETVQIRVSDNLCRVTLYEGVLINDASTTVTCCTDSTGRCSLSIYDQFGGQHDYADVLGTIFLRARRAHSPGNRHQPDRRQGDDSARFVASMPFASGAQGEAGGCR